MLLSSIDYGPIVVAIISGAFAIIGIVVPIFLARWLSRQNTSQHDDNKIAIEVAFANHREFSLGQFERIHDNVAEVRAELAHLDGRIDRLETPTTLALPGQVVVHAGHE